METHRLGTGSAARSQARYALLGLAAFVVGLPAYGALAQTPFYSLLGAWTGSGQIRYQDTQVEAVRCSAYYTKDGQRLKLAIRCRSASSAEIEIRGQIVARGEYVSGTWEERTFNASGEAHGKISRNTLTLAVTGGGFSGTMSVDYGGNRQAVSISTRGIAMESVKVTMTRGD